MHALWISLLLALFSISYCHTGPHFKHHNHKPKSQDQVRCFSQQELDESSEKIAEMFVSPKMDWDRNSCVSMVEPLEEAEKKSKRRKRSSHSTCPKLEINSNNQDPSKRSISPWAYTINVDENRYPQKIAFAHCLCEHCISTYTGRETSSLNSVLVSQSMLVLKKKTCPWDSSKFTFRVHYEKVPVACTCVVPK